MSGRRAVLGIGLLGLGGLGNRRSLAGAVASMGVELAAAPADCTAPAQAVAWAEADIRASRVEAGGARELPAQPRWRADPLNLFVVVEAGDDHISLVDGDRFERIHRFPSRRALGAAPQFTADGRYMFFSSCDGWVSKYDLWNLALVAEVRAGLRTRQIALSSDGRWVMVANALPHTLVLLDAGLQPAKVFPATGSDGKAGSAVAAVYDAALRSSFIATLQDIAELWEISYDPKAVDIYDGMVHDFRMGEGLPRRGFLGIRRTQLPEPLGRLLVDPHQAHALGAAQHRADGTAAAQVVNLDVRRRIAELPIAGLAHPAAGITFAWQGRTVMAIPNRRHGSIAVIDTKDWKLLRTIAVPGPGAFLYSHERTPYAWADAAPSAATRDTLTIIDKRTLEPVASVREPGRTLAHVAFTRDARHALAGLMEPDGALIVYDARTFTAIARLPMKLPVAHYNVGNTVSGRPSPPR